ncbi:putative transient receptor potential ion channel [Phaeomoniella chlamydospora]|uniref:Putative transient receptor potential ion channel n=1 Tax=Phaeomoniella chlamydospora TaxID=158046 RepID=A0A0G2DUG3_PHACM|nr:putative transient receptor potential ion channel [Phaeomoniella chlamydospora]
MTVLFHLTGNTALVNESVMMYLGIYAYGEPRFNLTFNPCNANIDSLCPMNASTEIEALAVIPVSESDISLVPDIALSIPDFEGMAILRIFSNSTESQIACYSAVLTNGATFSHPYAVAPVLGGFAAIAAIFSFLTTMHGDSVSESRKHYAHGVSIFMVFAIYQHIFFTGMLSMNWPSVLVAFWSNYAWSSGMIYSTRMQNAINGFLGSNQGNISMVGAAETGVDSNNLGGGYSIAQIYKRTMSNLPFSSSRSGVESLTARAMETSLMKRDGIANKSTGYTWYGNPVRPGLPLPGNYSGFSGTLAQEDIPASDAFMTGLIWFLVLIAGIVLAITLIKVTLEFLFKTQVIKTPRVAYFRQHWAKFIGAAIFRTLYIAFFMFMALTLFQFDFGGSAGVLGIAAVVFALFVVVMFGAIGFAMYYQWRAGRLVLGHDKVCFAYEPVFGFVPCVTVLLESSLGEKPGRRKTFGYIPWFGFRSAQRKDGEYLAHENERFTVRFGWLVSRYRDSRWWFPSVWLVYDLVRACFYGGAANHPLVQVFGLLAVECIAFILIVKIKPFEATRLNLILIYFLGFSKILTVALSSAFEVRFDQDRIICTVIGVVIIVIQGILTIVLMIAILVGAVSSYMSLTRNHEGFHPRRWNGIRRKYLKHIDFAATDRPAPPPPPPPPAPLIPAEPYFKVGSVVRQLKIEDEDEQYLAHRDESLSSSNRGYNHEDQTDTPTKAPSRPHSILSQTSTSNLPFGARPHLRHTIRLRFSVMIYDRDVHFHLRVYIADRAPETNN